MLSSLNESTVWWMFNKYVCQLCYAIVTKCFNFMMNIYLRCLPIQTTSSSLNVSTLWWTFTNYVCRLWPRHRLMFQSCDERSPIISANCDHVIITKCVNLMMNVNQLCLPIMTMSSHNVSTLWWTFINYVCQLWPRHHIMCQRYDERSPIMSANCDNQFIIITKCKMCLRYDVYQ
jgi:hypothetical protein